MEQIERTVSARRELKRYSAHNQAGPRVGPKPRPRQQPAFSTRVAAPVDASGLHRRPAYRSMLYGVARAPQAHGCSGSRTSPRRSSPLHVASPPPVRGARFHSFPTRMPETAPFSILLLPRRDDLLLCQLYRGGVEGLRCC